LQPVYDIYKATFSSERITVETTHLGGKGKSLLVDDTIRLSNVPGFIQVSITGIVANDSETMSTRLQVEETILKTFTVGRFSSSRVFHCRRVKLALKMDQRQTNFNKNKTSWE